MSKRANSFVRFLGEYKARQFAFEINRPLDTPKKRTDEFVWFPVKSKKTNKTIRLFVFWENLERANLLLVLSDL